MARVKGSPRVAAIRMKLSGSIRGEATQKAKTAGRGTPAASKAATRGTTPQLQNGDSAPASAASRIAVPTRRDTSRPIRRSAPAALSQAASATESSRKGLIQRKESAMKPSDSQAWPGTANAKPKNSAARASHTRSNRPIRWAQSWVVKIKPVIACVLPIRFDISGIFEIFGEKFFTPALRRFLGTATPWQHSASRNSVSPWTSAKLGRQRRTRPSRSWCTISLLTRWLRWCDRVEPGMPRCS